MGPELQAELDWINEATGGQQRRLRAQIIAWQMIRSTVQVLVDSYNDSLLTDSRRKPGQLRIAKRQRLQLKKTLLGYLREITIVVFSWSSALDREGSMTDSLRADRKELGKAWNRLQRKLTIIRNGAFHLGDFNLSPAELGVYYQRIDEFPMADLNRLLKSGLMLGENLRRLINPAAS